MRKDETGSEIVQFVCVLPLFLMVVFGIIQVAVAMFSAEVLSSELSQASIRIDTAGLVSATDKNRFVADEIIGQVSQLNPDALQVCNASVNTTRSGSTWEERNGTLQTRKTDTKVSFDVSYSVPTFVALPGWQTVELKRHVSFDIDNQKAVEVQVSS